MLPSHRRARRSLSLDTLEIRLNPANPITKAIELSAFADAKVETSGVLGNALAVMHNTIDGGLGNFPTNSTNSDFLLLSTGDATKAYAPRGDYPADGLDWGIRGSADDQQYLKFTIPLESYHQHLRFDLDFMTDEVPDVGNLYNDQFFILMTPVNAGIAEVVAQMAVNDDVFLSTPPVNSIFARHTGCYTVDYTIPTGATSLIMEIVLDDRPFSFNDNDRDGKGDSALALDNFRFNFTQKVWLNFDGGTFPNFNDGFYGDYPLDGGTLTFPAFQPADIRSAADRTTLINSVFADVSAKFAAYDIGLTLTQPTGPGYYSTIMVGGNRSTTIALNSGADPRLLDKYGPNPTIQAVKGNIFGHAESDYGNKYYNSRGFVLSGAFGLSPTYAADDEATLHKRLVTTLAHEIAHSLGAPHVADAFNDNIMAAKPPRSPDAYFEDVRRPIVGTLPDGRTELNIHGYLVSMLGLAAGTGFVNGASLGSNGRFFKLNFGVNLFDARIGISSGVPDSEDDDDTSVQWFSYSALHAGENEIELPNITPDSRITFYGSTTAGGPPDFFSGTPNAGDLDYEDSFLPLFDINGDLHTSLAAATGQLGSAVPFAGGVGLSVSPFTIAGLQPLPKTGLTFTDVDGDTVTVKLASKLGTAMVAINDPDGDGRGTLGSVELQSTQASDKLTITVKKNTALGGNGYTSVGAINGPALGTIAAKMVHLDGAGVNIGGGVKSMTFRDVLNGSDIFTGGTFGTTTALTTHAIGDGTAIDVGSRLKLTAARIGTGTVEAAMLTKLTVKGDKANSIPGDFGSDVTIDPDKVLSASEAKLNLIGSVSIAGRTIGATFTVPGNVGTFRTGTFENSSLLVGFTPSNPLTPLAGGTWDGEFKLGSFKALGYNGFTTDTFVNSHVLAAKLGSATIAKVSGANGGIDYGFAVKAGVFKNRGTIVLTNPATKILGTQPLPFNLTDFVVMER